MLKRLFSFFAGAFLLMTSAAFGVILAVVIYLGISGHVLSASFEPFESFKQEGTASANPADNRPEHVPPYEVIDASAGASIGSYDQFNDAFKAAAQIENSKIYYKQELVWESHYDLPQSTFLSGVPLIGQFPELPRGCEVTSLAMLLNFHQIEADKMILAEQIDKVMFEQNGLRGNPYEGFVGSMYTYDEPGLGVFHGPVAKLAQSYAGDRVADLTGSSFEDILYQTAMGRPVWVIITSTYNEVPAHRWQTWQTASGEIEITYSQHSVVITGFDEHYVYFNDPFLRSQRAPLKNFKKGWEQYGSQAITIF